MAATNTLRENLLSYYTCLFVVWSQDTIGIIIPMQEDTLNSESEHQNHFQPEQRIYYFRSASDTPQPNNPSNDFLTIQDLNRHLILAFEDLPLSYQSVYTCSTHEEIQTYLNRLKNCIIIKMNSQKIDPKYKIVLTAQNYIHEHIYDKLTLNETAAHIGVSPNYLSSLFGIYSDYGFSDYVSNVKVQKAKEILSHENKKVYEVSQLLGFENSHYFSKVYKKFTGYSPSETPYTVDSSRK